MENGKKPELGSKLNIVALASVLLRIGALVPTVAAALMMGLDKQEKTMVVAIIGTTPIYQTLVAKFQQTPAFVYFVVANAIASGYNLSVLMLSPFVKSRAFRLFLPLGDMVVLTLLATGVAAAATLADLAKNGNAHARWFSICDTFTKFCTRGGASIILTSISVGLMLVLNVLSTIIIHKNAM